MNVQTILFFAYTFVLIFLILKQVKILLKLLSHFSFYLLAVTFYLYFNHNITSYLNRFAGVLT